MSQSQAGSLKGLKTLVAFLGILVVVGTAVVAGVIIRRLYAPPSPVANFSAATPPAPAAAAWSPQAAGPAILPPGAKITGVAAAGGLFAVAISTPQGDQLWIINPATGGRYAALTARP